MAGIFNELDTIEKLKKNFTFTFLHQSYDESVLVNISYWTRNSAAVLASYYECLSPFLLCSVFLLKIVPFKLHFLFVSVQSLVWTFNVVDLFKSYIFSHILIAITISRLRFVKKVKIEGHYKTHAISSTLHFLNVT